MIPWLVARIIPHPVQTLGKDELSIREYAGPDGLLSLAENRTAPSRTLTP